MSPRRHHIARALLLVVLAMLVAACGPAKSEKAASTTPKDDQGEIDGGGTLILNGKVVDQKTGRRAMPKASADAAKDDDAATDDAAVAKKVPVRLLDPPPLNDDGTIAGTDPFAGERLNPMPTPIEGDPNSIGDFRKSMRDTIAAMATEDPQAADNMRQWVRAGTATSTRNGVVTDTTRAGLVSLAVERCGGARNVAIGAVLADEMVVTTVTAIDNAAKRVWFAPLDGSGPRLAGMLQYLDIDDDIAVFRVPGLTLTPLPTYVAPGPGINFGYAYGIVPGGTQGKPQRISVGVGMAEQKISVEQADGFGKQISDRSVFPLVGPVDTGYSGGVVTATNDPDNQTGWGFWGLVRARVPYESTGGGIVIPARLVDVALRRAIALDPWTEVQPGPCPNWFRPGRH